jgi:hypothetical protein
VHRYVLFELQAATGNGKVTKIYHSRARRGYGTYIEVDHGYGILVITLISCNRIDII